LKPEAIKEAAGAQREEAFPDEVTGKTGTSGWLKNSKGVHADRRKDRSLQWRRTGGVLCGGVNFLHTSRQSDSHSLNKIQVEGKIGGFL
jgi:hypothetical protein